MTALLGAGQLIFKVYSGSTGFDHAFHQFKGVQVATKSGFRISYDGRQVVDVGSSADRLDLVSPQQGIIDALDDFRY